MRKPKAKTKYEKLALNIADLTKKLNIASSAGMDSGLITQIENTLGMAQQELSDLQTIDNFNSMITKQTEKEKTTADNMQKLDENK
jgi:hypothetical protein